MSSSSKVIPIKKDDVEANVETGQMDNYLDIDEKWEQIRNGYERAFGMSKVFPKLQATLNAEANSKAVRNEGLDLLLVQGVDETMSRFSSVVLNMALVAALFLSVELSLYASPPGAITSSIEIVRWLYFGLSTGAVCSHFACLVAAVHILNWYLRLRTDADWINYCTDFDIGAVRDHWLVAPLVVGLIFVSGAIVLAAAESAGNRYMAIPAFLVMLICGITPLYFSRSVSVFVMAKYTDKPYQDRGISSVLKMYDERAKFDASFDKKV